MIFKIFRNIFLIALGFLGLFKFYGWIQAFMNFDVSDEGFTRDHYKYKIEGMEKFQCLCTLFDQHQFSGKVTLYDKSRYTTIEIELDPTSDSLFLKDYNIKDFYSDSGRFEFIKNGKMFFSISEGNWNGSIDEGYRVTKPKASNEIFFIGDGDTIVFNPYYSFESTFKSCRDLDTMNVQYNFDQFVKYNNLSRVQHSIDSRALVYMNQRIEEQNNSK